MVKKLSELVSEQVPEYSCELIKDGGVEIVKVKYKSSWSETINVKGDSIMAIFSKILGGGL